MITHLSKASASGASIGHALGGILSFKSVRYLLLCTVGLVLFLFAGILPVRHALNVLKQTNKDLQGQLNEQDLMQPLYMQLHQAAAQKLPAVVKAREPTLGPKPDLRAIPATIQSWAASFPLSQVLVQPRIKPLTGTNQLVCVDITLLGDFDGFRGFLTDLVCHPEVARLEQIHVEQMNKGKQCKVTAYLFTE